MLYPTLDQPVILIVVFCSGLAAGALFDVVKLLTVLSGKDRFSKHILDFLATIVSFAILFLVNLKINYGQFRVYVLALYLTGILLQRLISKFLWTKLFLKWYNTIRRKNSGREKEKT